MSRVALYVRVSTEEQQKHGISVDNQIQALNDYALEKGYTIVDIYNDAGISARKTYKKRPALLELLEACKHHKIDLILFTKLDRWFRSVGDYYEVQKILEENKVCWRAIWEDYETETANGIFKVNIMLSVAQSEADRTSERIKHIQAYKLEKGEYIGGNKAPLGYIRNGKQYVINPDEEAGVKAFFDTYLSTFNKIKAIEKAKENGLTLTYYQADKLLHHKAHYGALPYVIGTYITEEQHSTIESAKKTTKYYTNERRYIFSGLVVCKNCGNNMVVSRMSHVRKDGNITTVIRYVCKKHVKLAGCSGASIHEKKLEKYMLDSLDAELNKYNVSIKINSNNNNDAKIKALNSKLKRIRDIYELGDIDFEEYKNKRYIILEEITELQNIPKSKLKELPSNWKDIYNDLDVEHKRAFWFQTLSRIEIDKMCCDSPLIIF